MADYFSFEDVMHELELGEDELKRMVSEGELRAFRDENKMKFKKEDVEHLKKGRITEPTIILPSTPASDATDETVLDLDIGQESASLSDTSAHLASVGKEDDDLILQSDEVDSEAEETFLEEDSDTGQTTEPLELADEATLEAEIVTEEVAPPPAPAQVRRPLKKREKGARVGGRIPVAVEEEIERKRAHPIWTVFIFLAFIATAYSGFIYADMIRMETGKTDRPSEVTAGLVRWTLEKFWEDGLWVAFHEKKYPPGAPPPFVDKDPRFKHQEYNGPTIVPPRPTGPEEEVLPVLPETAPAEGEAPAAR